MTSNSKAADKPDLNSNGKPRGKAGRPSNSAPKIASYGGLDAVCDYLMEGRSMTSLCELIGVSNVAAFQRWVHSDPQRIAKVSEARRIAARIWDERAEEVLLKMDTTTSGTVAQARELANHYRWRAIKFAPKDYGDKLDVTADVTVSDLPEEKLIARAALLAAKLGIAIKENG